MRSDDEAEVPLLGGDVSDGVVRVGRTVRRALKPSSAAVHAYLQHLEQAGFDHAPRFLGIDDRGREILTYIEGEMGGRPLNPWAATESALKEIAVFQRRLHDCSLDVVLPDGVEWAQPTDIPGVPRLFEVADVVGHSRRLRVGRRAACRVARRGRPAVQPQLARHEVQR